MPQQPHILTINGGSSSIKFSLYHCHSTLAIALQGKITRIGTNEVTFSYKASTANNYRNEKIKSANLEESAVFLIDWLEKQVGFQQIIAVGHRIVHGMLHRQATSIDNTLINELKEISSYDPEHLPGEIKLIEKLKQYHPDLKQVACFDTAFHADLPRIAKTFPIPRSFLEKGIQRYGFHGLSYMYLLERLEEIDKPLAKTGRLILAHLGGGCSLAAIKDGKSVDTTMGFTPTGGLMMGTRPGDLDPGIFAYLFYNAHLDPSGFSKLINHQSGLLGVSALSSDMQELLHKESTHPSAKEAIALFCYQAKKWIGAYASVLNGVDALVFTGGIGENAAVIRSRICEGLDYLGLQLDEHRNAGNKLLLSADDSKVRIYRLETNEELMIAKITHQFLTTK